MEIVGFNIDQLTYWDWFGLALICLVIELAISGVYFFWIASAAVVVGLLLLVVPAMSWKWQLLIFSVDAIASIFVWKYFFSKQGAQPDVLLNKRDQKYIGYSFVLDDDIESGCGYVSIDDTRWQIQGDDLPAGTRVKVVSVKDQILFVEKEN